MSSKKKHQGLTLLEIIISIAILAIVSVPVYNMILSSIVNEKKADELQKGDFLAQQVFEYLKNTSDTLDTIFTDANKKSNFTTEFAVSEVTEDLKKTPFAEGASSNTFRLFQTNDHKYYIKILNETKELDKSDVSKYAMQAGAVANSTSDLNAYTPNYIVHIDNSKVEVKEPTSIQMINIMPVTTTDIITLTINLGDTVMNGSVSQGLASNIINLTRSDKDRDYYLEIDIDDKSAPVDIDIKNKDNDNFLKLFINKGHSDTTTADLNYEVMTEGKVIQMDKLGIDVLKYKSNKIKKIYETNVMVYKNKNGKHTKLQHIKSYRETN